MVADKRISHIRKGNMLPSKEKVEVCENMLIRIIVGARRPDKRKMDELRVEVYVKEGFKK